MKSIHFYLISILSQNTDSKICKMQYKGVLVCKRVHTLKNLLQSVDKLGNLLYLNMIKI